MTFMRAAIALAIFLASTSLAQMPPDLDLSSATVHQAPPLIKTGFDEMKAGPLPARFFAQALTSKEPGTWLVQEDPYAVSAPHVLRQSVPLQSNGQGALGYAALLVRDVSEADGDFSVSFQVAIEGDDQTAGLVYRYQDAHHFNVLLASAADNTMSLYCVRNGKWKVIAKGSAILMAHSWHRIRLVYVQNTYEVFLEDTMVLAGSDKKSLGTGQVGLVSAGDSKASFDNMIFRQPGVVIVPSKK